MALLGFICYYALQRLTRRPEADLCAEGAPTPVEPNRWVFGLQLGFFALYSGLATDTLATKLQVGVVPAELFAAAMLLHLLGSNEMLEDHFPASLTDRWRLVLTSGRWPAG